MKNYLYDFNTADFKTELDNIYLKRLKMITPNHRGEWQPETVYERGDVVFDMKNKFWITFKKGKSGINGVDGDKIKWVEYKSDVEYTVKNTLGIHTKGDISKFKNDAKYFDIIKVPEDVKIEQIAYQYYNDVNYWDIILVMNDLDTYTSLPTNDDIIIDKINEKLRKFGDKFGYTEEEYEAIENYINIGKFGVYKTPVDVNSGDNVYYMPLGTLLNYNKQLYLYNNEMPKRVIISLDQNAQPSDKLITIKDVTIKYNYQNGNSNKDIIDFIENRLDIIDIYGISMRRVNDLTIEISNNPNILKDYEVNSTGFDISYKNNIVVEDAIKTQYYIQVDSSFIETNTKKVKDLYSMYLRYKKAEYEKNEKFKKIKVLKSEYINELRDSYVNINT